MYKFIFFMRINISTSKAKYTNCSAINTRGLLRNYSGMHITRMIFRAKCGLRAVSVFGRAQISLLRNVIKEVASHLVLRRRHVPRYRKAKSIRPKTLMKPLRAKHRFAKLSHAPTMHLPGGERPLKNKSTDETFHRPSGENRSAGAN